MSAVASKSKRPPPPFEYVQRVAASRCFGGSTSLPRLLLYLAERAMEEPGETIKEFRIATEALGRRSGFDSRTDSVVRVTTARLRAKLEEYYAGEGAGDPLRLQIPKGSYRLLALPMDELADKAAEAGAQPPLSPARIAILAAAGLTCLAAGYFLGYRAGPSPPAGTDPEVARFWGAFGDSPGGVRVVYSNIPHLVTSYGRVLPGPVAAPDDWHTGVGEVQAVHKLAGVAYEANLDFDLKRALLVDWDEVVDVHVVYLGGPGANPQVAELGKNANFVFDQASSEDGEQYVIRNRAPAQGEQSLYLATLPLQEDYGIIRLTPGFRAGRWTLLLAGITTFGTSAAAEIVSTPETLGEIRTALGQQVDDPLEPFECLVEVRVRDSVPFDSQVSGCRPLAQ